MAKHYGVPVNRQKGDVESPHSGWSETVGEQQWRAEQEQKADRQKKEVAWLNDEFTTLAEWRTRRETPINWQVGVPQDEQDFQSYKLSRDKRHRLLIEATEEDLL
jgi:hypothetical protein